MGLIEKESKTYANIISDGTMRIRSDENDPKARKREYETSDGKSGVKWERVYKGISGRIIDLSFFDGDYGKTLNVTFAKEEQGVDDICLTLNVASNFAEDLMKKFPNVDFNREIALSPYAFTDDKGKNRKGIVVWQTPEGSNGKVKIPSFFAKETEDGKWEADNGIPTPEGDVKSYDSDDWKIHFTKVRKFLVKYTEENTIPRVEEAKEKFDAEVKDFIESEPSKLEEDEPNQKNDPDAEEINVDKIKFDGDAF